MNRNDIAIYITDAGWMIVAQGNPDQGKVEAGTPPAPVIAEMEDQRYYSQLVHRTAWIDTSGRGHIGTPTECLAARRAGLVFDHECFGGYGICAGDPIFVRKLSSP